MSNPRKSVRATIVSALAALFALFVAYPADAQSADFEVYDRTLYDNIDLVAEGAIRANLVTNTAWYPMFENGELPSESDFKAVVLHFTVAPGPVVLDFENIYLRGSIDRATAERRAEMWIQMLIWTHEVVGSRDVGIYNFVQTANSAYYDLATQVAAYEDAFFPAMYSYLTSTNNCGDQADWVARLTNVMAKADLISAGKPMIPLIWPQYYPSCANGGEFVSGTEWRWQLDTLLAHGLDGTYIFSGVSPANAELDWFNATVAFMDSL